MTKQNKKKDSQQINFIGNLENQAHRTTIFFSNEKSKEPTFENASYENANKCEFVKKLWKWIFRQKWYVIDNGTKGDYSYENPVKFLAISIESSLRDYSDIYFSYRKYCCYNNYCCC